MFSSRTPKLTIAATLGCIILTFPFVILFQAGKSYDEINRANRGEKQGLFGENDLDSFVSVESFYSASHSKTTKQSSSNVENDVTAFSCAPWILPPQRKVLFVELYTWKKYYGPSKYKTGEYYVSATWDYALRKNGFTVVRVSRREYYERMTKEEIMKYHLILVRDPRWHRFYDDHGLMCKVRPMYFFGGWFYGKNDHNYRFQIPFDEKQILTAYPDEDGRNTFMGYFPHNVLQNEEGKSFSSPEKKGRIGLLYGKNPDYFEGYEDVIEALLQAGFELHATCKDAEDKRCPFPAKVIRHGAMLPDEFADLMNKFSFVLGFKRPEGSPTPLVAISNGVAFLNPLREENGKVTQHKALSKIGFPYSYVVDLGNITDVVQAAKMACMYTFPSYVPPSFRVKSLVDRMCSLIEDESSCLIPK